MGFEVYERVRPKPPRIPSEVIAASNRRRRKPRLPAGDCPVCGGALPDLPPSQRRRFCSQRCMGIDKRGRPLPRRAP